MANPYNEDMDRNPANFQPLTPLMFLERAARVYPDYPAIIHGKKTVTYQEFFNSAKQLAGALVQHGIGCGDTVSVMLANTPEMLVAHYGVPMSGAVLHSINTRLDPVTVAFQLDHCDSQVLIVDREFSPTARKALQQTRVKPLLIDHEDAQFPASADNPPLSDLSCAAFIARGSADFVRTCPPDEWDAISLNYTSGTTGDPKGVVYHHRGAYLLAQDNILTAAIGKHPVYLWTLPMFHCNGWCFTWSLSVVIGTHVCLRAVRQKDMWNALADHRVTHLCGAPIVMSTLLETPVAQRRKLDHKVMFMTAAAPPPEAVLAGMAISGFEVTHLYGLTETYGPAVINDWKKEWNRLDASERARFKARQGVPYTALSGLSVRDPQTLKSVAADGKTIGEAMFRGNVVMKGYLKNKSATDAAFAGGWFHSGDLGVMHPDGYLQLKDRSKDIIISGGENISSIEVEDVLFKHPQIRAAAVVAMPHEKWGETPCAFVELENAVQAEENRGSKGSKNRETEEAVTPTAEQIVAWCREHLAHYKAPRCVVFQELPRTSTGKIQKFKLRETAREIANKQKANGR